MTFDIKKITTNPSSPKEPTPQNSMPSHTKRGHYWLLPVLVPVKQELLSNGLFTW